MLNHILPALAKVKPDVKVTVVYVPDSTLQDSAQDEMTTCALKAAVAASNAWDGWRLHR